MFLLRDMTSNSRVASAYMHSMHAALSISPTFEIKEIILSLGPHEVLLMGT